MEAIIIFRGCESQSMGIYLNKKTSSGKHFFHIPRMIDLGIV